MYTDITGYLPEWANTTLAIVGVVLVVVIISALAASTGGLASVALSAIAIGTGVGAGLGGINAAINGTSISGGIIGGGIEGFAFGTALGLGILTGAGAFAGITAVGAFATSLGINFVFGMLSYTIEDSMNGNTPNLKNACSCGVSLMIQSAFTFAAGSIIGYSGSYNIPGQKVASQTRIDNLVLSQEIRAFTEYPFKSYISQNGNYCG